MVIKTLPRVLYVDSDEAAGTEFQRLFAGARDYFEVVCLTDISAVIQMARDRVVDLFVLEYCLPSITGSQLCDLIRKTDKTTPIIMYSLLNRDVDRERAIASGANEFLVKPDEMYKLASTVNRLLFPMPLVPRHFHRSRRQNGVGMQ